MDFIRYEQDERVANITLDRADKANAQNEQVLDELHEAMADLRAAGCDLLTLGQYLQPTKKHLPVVKFIHPDQFAEYKTTAEAMGFTHVASGPLVRSSYHAGDFSLDR